VELKRIIQTTLYDWHVPHAIRFESVIKNGLADGSDV